MHNAHMGLIIIIDDNVQLLSNYFSSRFQSTSERQPAFLFSFCMWENTFRIGK